MLHDPIVMVRVLPESELESEPKPVRAPPRPRLDMDLLIQAPVLASAPMERSDEARSAASEGGTMEKTRIPETDAPESARGLCVSRPVVRVGRWSHERRSLGLWKEREERRGKG